ncbi:MAG: SEC-C metal-binding domain-containing protein [Bdellovibrionota bacterium]
MVKTTRQINRSKEHDMTENTIGRNEPCPCGSKKKYKRCCGVDAAPKLNAAKSAPLTAESVAKEAGMDPSQLDMAWMAQMGQMFQRLPRGQMQKLQSLVQRAMSGRDVAQEMEEFQHTLPLDLQQMLAQSPLMANQGKSSTPSVSPSEVQMTEAEARKIVEAAAAEGKITSEQAGELLKEGAHEKGGISKLWRGLTGKSTLRL